MLMRYDPFRELDRYTEQLFGSGGRQAWMPMDAVRRGDGVELHFDLPGVSPESIEVSVERNVLTIKAERSWFLAEGEEAQVRQGFCALGPDAGQGGDGGLERGSLGGDRHEDIVRRAASSYVMQSATARSQRGRWRHVHHPTPPRRSEEQSAPRRVPARRTHRRAA